jgi:hypothetical protein
MDIWSILLPFDIFYGHLVYFVVIWCIFPSGGILYQEKSGNLATGLLDGCKQKSHFGYPYIMKGLGMENVDVFYWLIGIFTAIW